jgi:nucleotide-binding universal stress UspA family protein
MRSWKRICCAIDLTERSRAPLDAAVHLANALGASLTLVHVWDPPPVHAGAPFAPPARPIRLGVEERAHLDAWLERARSRAHGDVTLEERYGAPAEEIVKSAKESGCGVVVVGTRGHTALRRALLGSVADGVTRHAGCPVLVVRSTEEDEDRAGDDDRAEDEGAEPRASAEHAPPGA